MRKSIGYGAYGYIPYGDFGITDQELSILGRCPNTQMPCLDSQGKDLWPLVAHLTEQQKQVLGRCPNTQMPCLDPPGDPNGIDLWVLARQGPTPTPAPSAPVSMPAPVTVSTPAPMPATSTPAMPASIPSAIPQSAALPPDIYIEEDSGMGGFVIGGVILLGLVGAGIYFATR